MKVVIIGSLKESQNKIKIIADYFESNDDIVIDPITINEFADSTFEAQLRYISEIMECDLVVAVSKNGNNFQDEGVDGNTTVTYKFGESTTYELALAKKLDKKILILG